MFPETSRGKTKLTSFPSDHTLSALLYTQNFSLKNGKNMLLYSARGQQICNCIHTFEFYQGKVTKNRPNTVLIL